MSNIFNMACMVTRKNILGIYMIIKFLEPEPPRAARVCNGWLLHMINLCSISENCILFSKIYQYEF